MSVTVFLSLLSLFSAVTGIATEGVKRVLDDCGIKYISNIVALIVALVVGCCGTAVYYLQSCIDFTVINVVYMVLLSLASGLSAMVGYDKVMQVIERVRS